MVNWKKIFMVATAVGAAVAGIAIAVVAGSAILAGGIVGLGLGMLSGGLVAGGVQAMMYAFSENASWGGFLKEFGLGFVIGAVTSLFSAGASVIFTSISRSLGTGLTGFLIGAGARMVSSMFLSVTSTIISNVWHRRKWDENLGGALKLGAILGVISCGVFVFQHINLNNAMEWAKRLTNSSTWTEHASSLYNRLANMPAGAWWTCKAGGEIAVNFVQNITIQYLMTGEVSFKAALAGTIVFAGLNLARQGIQYAKNRRDTRLIQKALNDAEDKTKENYNRNRKPEEQVSGFDEIPDSALAENGVQATTRMTDGNEETAGTNHLQRCKDQGASKSIPGQEKNLERAKTNLKEAQTQRQQAQDSLVQAQNELNEAKAAAATGGDQPPSRQQEIQRKANEAASGLKAAQRKLDMTEENVKRNERILQQCQATEQEIRENLKQYPDLKTREHPCAEPHALSQQKAGPSASRTHVTAGFERDIETKAPRLVIRNPCNECQTMPGENLSTTQNLAEHLAFKIPLPSGDPQPILDYGVLKSRRRRGSDSDEDDNGPPTEGPPKPPSGEDVANPPNEEVANDDWSDWTSSADEAAELLYSEEDPEQTDEEPASVESVPPDPTDLDADVEPVARRLSVSTNAAAPPPAAASDTQPGPSSSHTKTEDQRKKKSHRDQMQAYSPTGFDDGRKKKSKQKIRQPSKTTSANADSLLIHSIHEAFAVEQNLKEALKREEERTKNHIQQVGTAAGEQRNIHAFSDRAQSTSQAQSLSATQTNNDRGDSRSERTAESRGRRLDEDVHGELPQIPLFRQSDKDKSKKGKGIKGKMKGLIRVPKFLKPAQSAKMPEIFPIVEFDVDHQKYKLVNPAEWPDFGAENDSIRMIGVVGAHGSGKTRLIQSIIFRLGYAMTIEQTIAFRLRTGIFMYVLREDGIVILDCTDGIDIADNDNPENVPLGGVYTELFTYLTCDHLIFSINDQCLQNSSGSGIYGEVSALALNRLQMYTSVTNRMESNMFGSKNITFAVRYDWEKQEKLNALQSAAQTLFDKIDQTAPELIREEGMPVPTEEEALIHSIHHTRLCPMVYALDSGRASEPEERFENEMDALLATVVGNTNAHYLTRRFIEETVRYDAENGDTDLPPPSIPQAMLYTWHQLTNFDTLGQVVSSVANEHTAQNNQDADYDIDGYFKRVSELHKNAEQRVKDAIEEFFKYAKEAGERLKNTPDKDKDPLFGVRLVLDVADRLLRASNGNDQDVIDLALDGYCLFVSFKDENAIGSLMALKLALRDYRLLPNLSEQNVYKFFSKCWYLLRALVHFGFRVRMLEFPLIDALRDVLYDRERNEFVTTDSRRLVEHAYRMLVDLMSDDSEILFGDESAQSQKASKKDALYFKPDELVKLTELLRLNVVAKAPRLVQEVLDYPHMAKENHELLLEFAQTWYSDQELAKRKPWGKLDESQQFELHKITFKTVHRVLGSIIGRHVVGRLSHYLAVPSAEFLRLERIGVLSATCNMAEHDTQDLFFVLLRTNVVGSVLKILLDDKSISWSGNMRLHGLLTSCLIELLVAERSARIEEPDKFDELLKSIDAQSQITTTGRVNTLNDVTSQEKRRERINQLWFVRTKIYDRNTFEVVFERFLTINCNCAETNSLLTFLVFTMVSSQRDKDLDRACICLIYTKRIPFIERLCKVVIPLAVTESDKWRGLSVMESVCQLLNSYMLHFAHSITGIGVDLDTVPIHASNLSEDDHRGGALNERLPSTDPPSRLVNLVLGCLASIHDFVAAIRTDQTITKSKLNRKLASLDEDWLCLLYNVSAKSRVNYSRFLRRIADARGNVNVHGLNQVDNSDDQKDLKILHDAESLAKLDASQIARDKTCFHSLNTRRGADLVHDKTNKRLTPPLSAFIDYVERKLIAAITEAKMQVANREVMEKVKKETKEMMQGKRAVVLGDVDAEEIRERRQQLLGNVAGPSNAQNPTPPPPSPPTLLACDDIELMHDLFGEETPLKKSDQANEVLRALQGIRDKNERLLVRIYLDNDNGDVRRAMDELLKLYETNDPTGQLQLETIALLMSFGHVKHFERLLDQVEIDLYHKAPTVNNERLEGVVQSHAILTSRVSSFGYRLRQVFNQVDERIPSGEQALLDAKLPPVFYGGKELANLSTCSIADVLRLKKPGNDRQVRLLRDDNELKYTLVRVEDARGQMIHQTVFASNATIRSVLDRYRLVDSSACGLKHRDRVLDLENGTLSGYRFAPAVYLVALRNNQ